MTTIPENPQIAERLAMYDSWDAVAPLPNPWEKKKVPDITIECAHPGGAKYALYCKVHDFEEPTYLCDICISRQRYKGCGVDNLHRVILK